MANTIDSANVLEPDGRSSSCGLSVPILGGRNMGWTARSRAARSGMLTCFANDLSMLYFNNSGSIQLTVTQL